jgi:TolB-like protein/tetratricopeptide (TPR) repeat protein
VRAAVPAPSSAAERGRRFLVLPFRNVSRGAEQEWLVEGATAMLGESLGRWREIRVVADDRLYPALRRHGLTAGAVIAPERVRRLAEETDGWTVVTGSVVASGGRLRVTARAYDVVTNREVVANRTVEGPVNADVRPMFEAIATRLLHAAGLDTASATLIASTTSSLDAYRAYLRGMRYLNRAQFRQATDALLEAVRIDSTFAQAHLMLIEAALFADPFVAPSTGSVMDKAFDRSLSLVDHFAPADREIFLGVDAIFSGRLAAGREMLARRVALDSSDIRAVAWLGFLEYLDGVLVSTPTGQRRRGNPNENMRLARRVLALDPARHDAYLPIVGQYALAAGSFPAIQVGWRSESGNLVQLLSSRPARVFVPLLRDSIVLVPAESLSAVHADTLAAARRRALDSATAVSNRWLAAGPFEGLARHVAAEVANLGGEYNRALEQLRLADSLGVEFGALSSRLLRMAIFARVGRYDDARRAASADGGRIPIGVGLNAFMEEGSAAAWAFNLSLMAGDIGRSGELLDAYAASLRGMMPDSMMAQGVALALLSGGKVPPLWQVELPLTFRMDVLDSVYARTPAGTGGPRLESARVVLARLLSHAAVQPDVGAPLADRARRSAWFVP